MSEQVDGITELVTGHREVEKLFVRLENTPPGTGKGRTLADRLTIELIRHCVAEEEHLCPAVRQHVPGGEALADRTLAEHARIEQFLKDLEGLEEGDPRFVRFVGVLKAEFSAHVRNHEGDVVPGLRHHCPTATLGEMGARIRDVREAVPIRPRAGFPAAPAGNTARTPGAGLVEMVRHALHGHRNGTPARIGPAELWHALKGADFPARREDLIRLARDNGASEALVAALANTSAERFDGKDEVRKAVCDDL
ncbi:hemerythrin domain-containing protein [Streptomyces candidus]|uniref:Hemerythrin-like domain-containing protein n=1 Tax=Streptomyces candidus TaxID=67283 RepID=A0A7X0HJ12_9ACTN|nr:hemerythrin domain-containing protein [Streptomyces candidus]MBB6438506.1 hypothetical protein [Streptomyces candidus]GHH45644.1 hypothetical protein GCM10018773_35460 [Streptomyces candidus]